MMVFMMEIFFTASLSLCLAFLFAKLVSMASAKEVEGGGVLVSKKENLDKGVEGVLMEDRKLMNQELEVLEKVEFVGGESMKVSQVMLVEEEALEKSSQFCAEKHELVEFEKEEGSNVDHSKVDVVKEESEVELKLEEQGEIRDEEEDEPIADENKLIEGASFEIKSENIEKKEKEKEKEKEKAEEEIKKEEKKEEEKEEVGVLVVDEDDDWEGIEKSEVEKLFGPASKFLDSNENNEIVAKLGNDVKMELYGLQKVAMEGPCREGPPIAIMVSARAKWNAWQRLGNMTPEVAMEQYITLLSSNVPGWMGGKPEGNYEQDCGEISLAAEESKVESQESSSLHHQPESKNGRNLEKLQSHGETSDAKSL